MKHKFACLDRVLWVPGCQGFQCEAQVMELSHYFWLMPAYRIYIDPTVLKAWFNKDGFWTVPEASLRRVVCVEP